MRILFIASAFPPFPGGGERYTRSLALNLVQCGHAVTVLTSAAKVERDLWQGCGQQIIRSRDEGIAVIRCPIRSIPGGWPGLLAWRKLMVLISMLPGDQTAVLQHLCRLIPSIQNLPQTLDQLDTHFDLVHGFNISWEYPLIVGRQFAQQHGYPFVITPFAHFGTGHDRVARNSTMDHQLRLLQQAALILSLTSVEQKGLAQYGITPERGAVIGGGLDPLPAAADFTLLQQKYNLTQPFVIFIGRHSYEKGAIHAAQAILALRQQGSQISLLLVGQMTQEFNRFYRRLTDSDKAGIRPLGILSEPDKHALLEQAQMLLLPSRTDSFGIVLLEAWAHGKPVIGAQAGGLPGVIDDGLNGLLVPFGNVTALAQAVQYLLLTPDLKQALGQQGQAKVTAEYSWSQVTDRVESHYQQLLANPHSLLTNY